MTKILDCTIRDGGHINCWNFEPKCVKASYEAALSSGVDIFEIGYRYENLQKGWGKFSKCEDKFLSSFITPNEKCRIAVMADAGKSTADEFQEYSEKNTIISLVRVATYSSYLEEAFDLCEKLHDKGYSLYLNLMAIAEYSNNDFKKLEKWDGKKYLEAVCFADSFGAFIPQDVEKYYKILKKIGFNNISFHSHNNMQLAFANTLKALELNLYSVDASIMGMGRDAGNLPIELLVGYLNKNGKKDYSPVPYIDLIDNYYNEIFNKNAWGYSIKSLLSGLKNIHPYYVSELYTNRSFSNNEIWNITEDIKKSAPIYYNENVLKNILTKYQ